MCIIKQKQNNYWTHNNSAAAAAAAQWLCIYVQGKQELRRYIFMNNAMQYFFFCKLLFPYTTKISSSYILLFHIVHLSLFCSRNKITDPKKLLLFVLLISTKNCSNIYVLHFCAITHAVQYNNKYFHLLEQP